MMQTIALVVIAFISLSICIAASRSFSTNVLRNNIEVAQSPAKAIVRPRTSILVSGVITTVSPLNHTVSVVTPNHYSTSESTVLTVGFDDNTVMYDGSGSSTSKAILKLIGLPVRLNIATRNGPLYALGLRTITTDQ